MILCDFTLDRRWYKFQNMVPSPRGCSGHAMTSVGAKVLVLGGESFPQSAVDPNIIHVLNTSSSLVACVISQSHITLRRTYNTFVVQQPLMFMDIMEYVTIQHRRSH